MKKRTVFRNIFCQFDLQTSYVFPKIQSFGSSTYFSRNFSSRVVSVLGPSKSNLVWNKSRLDLIDQKKISVIVFPKISGCRPLSRYYSTQDKRNTSNSDQPYLQATGNPLLQRQDQSKHDEPYSKSIDEHETHKESDDDLFPRRRSKKNSTGFIGKFFYGYSEMTEGYSPITKVIIFILAAPIMIPVTIFAYCIAALIICWHLLEFTLVIAFGIACYVIVMAYCWDWLKNFFRK